MGGLAKALFWYTAGCLPSHTCQFWSIGLAESALGSILWRCCTLLLYSIISRCCTYGENVNINSDWWERCEISEVKMHSCSRPLQFSSCLCRGVVFSLKNRFTSVLNTISCEFGKPVLAQSEHNLLLFCLAILPAGKCYRRRRTCTNGAESNEGSDL